MLISQLDDYDFAILESYWFNYQNLSLSIAEETNANKKRNIENVTSAIEQLYNESEGVMRKFIEEGYFNSLIKKIDRKHLAEQLDVTPTKISYLQKGLLQETAKRISYV